MNLLSANVFLQRSDYQIIMLNIREEQILFDLLLELGRHGTGAPRRLAGDSCTRTG